MASDGAYVAAVVMEQDSASSPTVSTATLHVFAKGSAWGNQAPEFSWNVSSLDPTTYLGGFDPTTVRDARMCRNCRGPQAGRVDTPNPRPLHLAPLAPSPGTQVVATSVAMTYASDGTPYLVAGFTGTPGLFTASDLSAQNDTGVACVFRRVPGKTVTWALVQVLSQRASSGFGFAVGIAAGGATVVVSAYEDKAKTAPVTGDQVFVYRLNPNTGLWTEHQVSRGCRCRG